MLMAAGRFALLCAWLVTDMEALAVRSLPALGAAAAAAAEGAASVAFAAVVGAASSSLTNSLFSYLALIHLSRTMARSYSLGLM